MVRDKWGCDFFMYIYIETVNINNEINTKILNFNFFIHRGKFINNTFIIIPSSFKFSDVMSFTWLIRSFTFIENMFVLCKEKKAVNVLYKEEYILKYMYIESALHSCIAGRFS